MRPCNGTTSGTSLDPRDIKGTPQATGGRGSKTSRSPPGRRCAVTPQNANGGHHPEWVPPLARTEAPSDRSPRGGAQAVLTPQRCKAARRSTTRRQGTLAAPAAAAAHRLPRHGKSSFTRIRTETMEVPTTPTPNGHHLPPIPDAGPRGPAPNGRTSPPFPRQPSASNRQRFTQAPARQQTKRPADLPPPSQGRRPARCRGDSSPRTHGQGNPRPTNGLRKRWGDNPPNTPPRERGVMTPVPDTGTGHPTNQARAPRGSPSQLQHGQTAKARRAHRNNRSTTRAAQGRTQK